MAINAFVFCQNSEQAISKYEATSLLLGMKLLARNQFNLSL